MILCDVYSCVWNTDEGKCESPCVVISDKWSDGPRCLEDLDAQIQERGFPTNSHYVYGLDYDKKMVREYLKDGWILVDKNTHLDEKDHMSIYFLTIENDEGFRRTVIARYDCVDGCFKHYSNHQKIAGKCIAYKEYCLPTPYEGDRHE